MIDRLYNVPANAKPDEEWKEVILSSSSPSEVVQAFNDSLDRLVCVRGLVLTLPPVPKPSRFDLESDFARLEVLPEDIPIEIHVWPEELSRLYLWRIMLRRFKTAVALEACRGFSKFVKDAARMGYPVKIGPSSFTGKHQKELRAISRYYFHSRDLKVPIEPVHTLFRTWVSGKGADLWEVYRKDTERHIHIREDGKRAASTRLKFAGHFHETVSNWSKAEAFKQMRECSVCVAFRICGGTPKYSAPLGECKTILELADLFREEAMTMAEEVRALLS